MNALSLYNFLRRLKAFGRFFSISRLLVAAFALAILIGCVLLAAPSSTADTARPASFLDALFTATSAVCVTGLIVRDTGNEFSLYGQVVILILIQAGGLGILTFSNLLFLFRRGRVGFRDRMILEQTHGLLPNVTPGELLLRIILYTVVFETFGAVLLTWRFALDYPFSHALWLGIFHSISAFCNAGFSLFSNSLIGYQTDPWINAIVMALIVCGGLGALVFADFGLFIRNRLRRRRARLTLHTRVVLLTTAVLILVGATTFWLLEWRSTVPAWPDQRFLTSLFLSITARTAGFNTIDMAHLTNATLLIVIFLMVIGGSPGSTAGGIKTTTFAALIAQLIARTRNRPRAELLHRSIPDDVIAKAVTTTVGFLTVAFLAVILLQVTELAGEPHHLHRGVFLDYVFEVFSALATVGLSTGITGDLSSAGRFVIIACMFLGRLGPLIVASSLIGTRRQIDYTYPEGRLNVG
ncbi:hypothetical protein HQ520_09410 [bacterium]|nr:hypothetical protein [bacterium]